jgi:hypothetical protein
MDGGDGDEYCHNTCMGLKIVNVRVRIFDELHGWSERVLGCRKEHYEDYYAVVLL